ncbi:MAG: hypothetical protein MJY75_05330 [Bacteroidaceae bacterium]|nr:hypothetical protein [Bacteroidaceae bacterium]
MKKLLPLFFLAATALFASCEIEGPEMKSYEIGVETRDWLTYNEGGVRYQYTDLSFPEIDSYMMEEGLVEVSLIAVNGGREVQHPLPYTFTVIAGDRLEPYTVTETIRYEVSRGLLTLVIEYGDGEVYPNALLPYTFRVTTVDKY